MNRKVSICTLCASSAQGATAYLQQRLGEYAPDAVSSDFGDAASFVAGIGNCASQGGIVIAAAPLPLFLKAKLGLLKFFSEKVVRSSAILAAMGENAPENPKEKDFHSAVPEKSKVFASKDGLYSAFAKEFGESIVVFLPLDEKRLEDIFASDFNMIFGGIPKKPKSKLSQLKNHIQKVIDSEKTVAISPCGSAKAMLSVISTVPDCETAFVPDSSATEQFPNESTDEYIAKSAKLSKENASTDLGIGISDILNDDNGQEFVFVCVADSERAKVAKVFAESGENKKQLIAAAVIQICEMLDELSATGLINPNLGKAKPEKAEKNFRTPLIIAISALAVAIIACFITAFILGSGSSSSSVTNAGQYDVFQGIENTLGTEIQDYYGGSGLGPIEFEDALAAVQPEESTSELTALSSSTLTSAAVSTTKTSVSKTVTQVLTTIKKVTTTKATTTKITTTTEKPTSATTVTATAKPTTTSTTKATTTEKTTVTTTQNASTSSSATVASNTGGTFVFKTYGYGHGVGMSQHGAMEMANNGKTYTEILTHYYPGTTVKTDSATPATINYGGKDIPIVEYICKTTKQEMGYSSAHEEAVKAQIVVIYTFAKNSGFVVPGSKHAYSESFDYKGSRIYNICLDLLGMSSEEDTPCAPYVDYNGEAAFTCYFSRSAGKTASSSSVWGVTSTKYPYLSGGISSPETVDKSEYEISAEDMKKLIKAYDKNIELSDNPAEWLEIVSHDGAYSSDIGYITSIKVGDKAIRGNSFRADVMKYKIRSHCFTVEYIPE